MKNPFFRLALEQASRLLGKPGRLLKLVAQLSHRLYHSDRKELSVNNVRERFQMLGRLVIAYTRGQYRTVPMKTLISVIAAVIYFLNPIDLVPDFIFGLGLADDLAVLTWVFHIARQELDEFKSWEATQLTADQADLTP